MEPREHEQDGYTLIELILAVAIMGITFVAVLAGIAATVATGKLHRDQADVNTVVVAASEQVKAAPFVVNANASTYLGAAQNIPASSLPSGWPCCPATSVTIPAFDTSVIPNVANPLFWDGTKFQSTNFGSTQPFLRLQQVKVVVTSPDGRASQAIYVVKRG